jgi:hypothetical protein
MTPQTYWNIATWQMKDCILSNCAEKGGFEYHPYLFWSFDLLPTQVKMWIAYAARENWMN